MDPLYRFSVIFSKKDDFQNFLLAFLKFKPLQKACVYVVHSLSWEIFLPKFDYIAFPQTFPPLCMRNPEHLPLPQ